MTAANLVVVANRLPVDYDASAENGHGGWRRSPGGLVTALEPVLRAADGAWVGWPGAPDVAFEPFTEDGITLHPVTLAESEVADYYEGFSNATLWPLYHDAIVAPVYDRTWWRTYVSVNRRFAEAAAAAAAPDATVWVHDYQLQLVPKMLRELRPDLKIGFFLHIPFPPTELFLQLPWRTAVVEGLLGADLVGFHLPGGARNFLYLAQRLLGLRTSAQSELDSCIGTVEVGERRVQVGAFPISIDSAHFAERARMRHIRERAAEIRAELGNPELLLLGVDRLDYTKGIDIRLAALHELLDEGTLDPQKVVMVQLATPSRERVSAYAQLREDIERQVGHLNGEYGQLGRPVVHYLHRPVDRDELVALYRAADIMLVTPLRDGMNLVAKEYIACRTDGTGALVLSEFTGAASELRRAHLVNPHDLDAVKRAIVAAATEDTATAARRMQAMRTQVLHHDVERWANAFLTDLRASGSDGAAAASA